MKITIEATVHVEARDLDDLKRAGAEQLLATARMQNAEVTVSIGPDKAKRGKSEG